VRHVAAPPHFAHREGHGRQRDVHAHVRQRLQAHNTKIT
jgi:hypothetical protein